MLDLRSAYPRNCTTCSLSKVYGEFLCCTHPSIGEDSAVQDWRTDHVEHLGPLGWPTGDQPTPCVGYEDAAGDVEAA